MFHHNPHVRDGGVLLFLYGGQLAPRGFFLGCCIVTPGGA
jgi:hypothetical protein